MNQVKDFPEGSGVNPWYELSRFKEIKFKKTAVKDSYDYIVVGAGFGGVSAAYRLVENNPSASVALIDSLPVGFYSSGRNAGFISYAQIAKSLIGLNSFTVEDQKYLLYLNKIGIDRIEKIKKEKNLDFEWRNDGMYKAVRNPKRFSDLDALDGFYNSLEVEHEMLDAEETARRLGTDFYVKSVYVKDGVLNNPSEAVRALALSLPENVDVFENTSVIALEQGTHPSVILSDGKQVKAAKIILTVSAFIKEFGFGRITDPVAAIHSFGAMTRRLTDEEFRLFQDVKPWGLVGTHPSSCTVRFTPDRRIFVRTDIAFATHLNIDPNRKNKAVPLLRRAFDRRFPALSKVNFEYVYGGLISFTANAKPLFGEVGKNVYAGVTPDGSGVPKATILGNYLADLVCGVKSDELDYISRRYIPGYLPPEPFRTIGAGVALWYKNFQAGIEL
ncbi:MAG: NAD(P)/FAD-dependent oxidoreductase [Succinivibrio sp.]